MARGDWVYSGLTNLSERSGAQLGLRWRYTNSAQDAFNRNADDIQIRPFIIRKNSSTYPQGNNWHTSNYQYSYGSYNSGKKNFNTRYWFGTSSTNGIAVGEKYYITYNTGSANASHPFITNSSSDLGIFNFTIPHKDDGTQDTVKITLFWSGEDSHGNATLTYSFKPDNILRAPNVAVSSYEIYNNSIRVGVYSTNSIALDQVQVSYTENGTTYSYMEEVDEDGYIYLWGLNPKTTYTFNLKGYNNANSALETTGVNVTYTTGPNPIGVNSITVDLNNASYNNDSMETWTVGFLANLSYGNGNSISDLYSIDYTIEDSQGVVVGTGSKYQNNYASYFYLSGLNPEETYKVTAEALTYMTPGSTSYWVESTSRYFTTLDKNKKAWIKNSQNQWTQGILYIKTDSGWKIAKKIYRKTGENTWTESIN